MARKTPSKLKRSITRHLMAVIKDLENQNVEKSTYARRNLIAITKKNLEKAKETDSLEELMLIKSKLESKNNNKKQKL